MNIVLRLIWRSLHEAPCRTDRAGPDPCSTSYHPGKSSQLLRIAVPGHHSARRVRSRSSQRSPAARSRPQWGTGPTAQIPAAELGVAGRTSSHSCHDPDIMRRCQLFAVHRSMDVDTFEDVEVRFPFASKFLSRIAHRQSRSIRMYFSCLPFKNIAIYRCTLLGR